MMIDCSDPPSTVYRSWTQVRVFLSSIAPNAALRSTKPSWGVKMIGSLG